MGKEEEKPEVVETLKNIEKLLREIRDRQKKADEVVFYDWSKCVPSD